MGVPGLWDLIRPAAARSSLSTLARDAFFTNRNDSRALMIGIDASIWIFHAQIPQGGENPFLRTIFYKIATLLQQPVLPVFVFDGPEKPRYKRNCAVKGDFGTRDWRSKKFKELLDVCGLEWWNAPGEAEAELAVMNRQGKIDAVLSDDVDALLFGATKLLRNNSPTLSGAKASSTQTNSSRGDQRHYEVYSTAGIRDLWSQKEGSALQTEEQCRMAMILIALLGGGDYAPEGLAGFGATTTHGLAHAGFAEFLSRYDSNNPSGFQAELREVHARMVDEIRTNSTGHVGKKYAVKARDLEQLDPFDAFPASALDAYLQPATSPLGDPGQGWPGFGRGEASSRRGKARNEGRGDMEGMARACEKYFEWGTKDIVTKKFASENVGIFGGALLDEARSRVRRAGPALSPSDIATGRPRSPITAPDPSRLTDFFVRSGYPIQREKPASAAPIRQLSTQRDDAGYPEHVMKIHSTRPDPTNPALQEYRIAYRSERYATRCQDAMAGTRCDPRDLPTEERQSLGLVDRTDDDYTAIPTASQAQSKAENRVWLPEYLVRAAWPVLVHEYEDDLRLKAEKKARTAKKPVEVVVISRGAKAAKSKKPAQPAAGVNTEKFKTFFTAQTNPRPRNRKASASNSGDEEEQVEFVESPKKTTVQLPSSPPSSGRSLSPSKRVVVTPRRQSGKKKPATARPGSRSPSPTPKARGRPKSPGLRDVFVVDLSVSPPPSPSVRTRQSKSQPSRAQKKTPPVPSSASSTSSRQADVIDLCSSDDEDISPEPSGYWPLSPGISPVPLRRSPRVRNTSPKGTRNVAAALSPPVPPRMTGIAADTVPATRPRSKLLTALGTPSPPKPNASKRQPSVGKAKQSRGVTVVPTKQPSLDISAARTSPPRKATVSTSKQKKPDYVVVYEDDDLEVLDCRRR